MPGKIGLLCAMLAASAVPALALSGASAQFDGEYSGTAEVIEKASVPSCVSQALENVTIRNGQVRSRDSNVSLNGFVTTEGYLDASMKLASGTSAALGGRIVEAGTTISTGAIDDVAGCSWIVKLHRND